MYEKGDSSAMSAVTETTSSGGKFNKEKEGGLQRTKTGNQYKVIKLTKDEILQEIERLKQLTEQRHEKDK